MRSLQVDRWLFLSTLVFLGRPSLAESVTPSAHGECSVFEWDHQDAVLQYADPMQVSGAKYCANSKDKSQDVTCPLVAEGDAQFKSHTNVTAFHNATLYTQLVEKAVSAATLAMPAPYFNDTVYAPIDQKRSLEGGQAGYINFTALEFCYTGTLGNCRGSIKSSTIGKFCAPVWSTDGDDVEVSGFYTVQTIPKDNVGNYGDPYARQSSSDALSSSQIQDGFLVAGLAVSFAAILV